MVFSLLSVLPEEPAYAAGEFDCNDSDGRGYAFQSTWSSGTLTITRGSNNSSNVWSTSTLQTYSSFDGLGSIDEINSLSITKEGHMFAFLKQNDNDAYLIKLNSDGSVDNLGALPSTGDNNAASYYETVVSGTTYRYIFTSKGFFNGNNYAIRINSSGAVEKVISLNITNGSLGSNKAKDYAWLEGSSSHDFIAYDANKNDLLGATVSHSSIGTSSESITVTLAQRATNVGSGMGSNSGAAISFKGGKVYFLENDTGDLWLYDLANDTSTGNQSDELVETSDDFNNSSNTDGAGCGTGDPEEADETAVTVAVSTAINTCSNGTATTTVTFVGSGSGTTQYYDLQRRENGGSWSDVVNGESIAAGETNTHTSSAFDDGTLVEWQYRIGDSNPSSGSYITAGTGSGTLTNRTIDCDLTFTISTTINSVSYTHLTLPTKA